ncbi:NUMOD4 domain-containing protein [uncultured Chryseobacterium sp.]|uniref:NUMOD4 domain-containing protein n=1 Tax=uncultured Chryseobacterium sp. TaxID=259322 RepID=UPI002582A719|nr:NUMOD4 domain-containing protein [uncultured Chryseobacterium sp.]
MAEGVTGSAVKAKYSMSRIKEDLPGEEWKEIKNYPDRYMVSNYGRIKSVIKKTHIILKKSFLNNRFHVVLTDKRGRQKIELCGRLLASEFLRYPEENEVIKYKNGNKKLDVLDNIEWTTKRESIIAAVNKGCYPLGLNKNENNAMAILSKKDVQDIRRKRAQGVKCIDLKNNYNVSLGCIQKIVSNKTWRDI